MSRLTFIVPVYEPDLAILGAAVKALAAQSLKLWDAVFILDGANEPAANIITQAMKKVPNKYRIETIEHGGAQKARNYGAKFAKGEFLVFFDADCVIEPDTAKTWVEMFDKYPDVAFVYSGYRFLDEQGAIDSEPFDPWLLRVRNYISTCFPLRRDFFPGWNESLLSLQDWDFWLSVVEKGGKGKFMPGYAFATAYPTEKSISGQGCTPAAWLDRIDAVKKTHGLPERDVCVSSLTKKHEGIWLAKLIDADYQDVPNDKPHRYKTIIQLGFSFLPGMAEVHSGIFREKTVKKVVLWTCDDITEIYSRLNLSAIHKYSILLNSMAKQYVEDKAAHDMMTKAGFNVEILPLPMEVAEVSPLPAKPRFAVDIDPNYGFLFNTLEKSLPDVELKRLDGAQKMSDFTGLCHFHPDRTVSIGMKRAILAGRHVISNVQAPHMGYIDDSQEIAALVPQAVEKIRGLAYAAKPAAGRDYYIKTASPENLKNELVKA